MHKGLIFDIQHASLNDGPGLRTTVFMKGCPLKCLWCHNPESKNACIETLNDHQGNEKIIGKWWDVDELMPLLLKDKPFYGRDGGVTISGGEPLLQADFTAMVLKKLKQNKVHTCVDTSGYANESSLMKVLPYTSLFLFDIKLDDEEKHIKYTGKSNRLVMENLEIIGKYGVPVIIRVPLVKDVNTHDGFFELLKNIRNRYPNIQSIELLPYHDDWRGKYEHIKYMPFKSVEKEWVNVKQYEINS